MGKARDYLEKSLSYGVENSEIYQELGELFEALGEPIAALTWFKKRFSTNTSEQLFTHDSH